MNREEEIIAELTAQDNLRRTLDTESSGAFLWYEGKRYVNLSSNDYLGLADTELQEEFLRQLPHDRFLMSNPASRLMTGNSPDYSRLERSIAGYFGAEAALVLGSGYLLNSGLPKAITQKGDLIISDKLVHASMIDGILLSEAEHIRYRHNDISHLESILRKNSGRSGRILVMTESIFSMDGDRAPLKELAELQDKYGFRLYLDEAHAFGVLGTTGCGLAQEYNARAAIPIKVDYLIATMGKALASQGAFVVCDRRTRELLVNRMRTVIFSTALPPVSLLWSGFLLEKLPGMDDRRQHLARLIKLLGGQSQIMPIMAGSNARALEMAEYFRMNGYWATAIRHPTVPEGTARVRVSLTAAITEQQATDFKKLCDTIG